MVKDVNRRAGKMYSFLTDPDFNVIKANKLFLSSLDIPSQPIIGKSFYEVMKVVEKEKCEQARVHCLAHPEHEVNIDLSTYGPQGLERCFRWDIRAINDAAGKVSHISFTGTDVTLKKLLEKQVFYEATLLDNISDAVISTDEHFVIKSWNRAAASLYRLSAEEVKGKAAAQIIPYEYITGSEEECKTALEANGRWNGRLLFNRADGHRVFLEVSITAVKDEDRTTGYVWVNRDISSMVPGHGSLSALTSYDQVFLDSLFEGIMVCNKKGEVLICNKAAEQVLGLTFDQMKGRTPTDPGWSTIHEDGSPFPGDQHPSIYTLRTGESCSDVVMGVRKPEGTLSWVRINSQPVYFSGSDQPDAVTCSFVDITPQRQLLKAFNTIERNQKLVLSSTNVCFFLLDHYFRVKVVNKAGETFIKTMLLKDMAVGDFYPDLVTEDRRPFVDETLQKVSQGAEVRYEWQKVVNGRWYWFFSIYRPVFNDEQQIVGVYITIKDITREKETRQALKRSEERFRVLFNSSYEFMTLLSLEGEVLEANQTVLQFSGLQPKDVIGLKVWDTVLWKNAVKTPADIKSAMGQAANGEFIRYELNLIGRGGMESAADFSIRPIREENGTILMLIAEGRILDEQKKFERELRDKDLQFRSFMENTPAHAWITDEFHVLRYINPLCMKLYGYTKDIIGSNLEDVFPADIYEEFIATNNAVLTSGKPLEIPERQQTIKGVHHVQHVFKFPLGVDSNGVRLIGGVFFDITAQANIKCALEKSNERYEFVRKATSDAIWDWDIVPDKIQLGENSTILFGCTEMITSMQIRIAHVHPEDRDRYGESIRKALVSGGDFWQEEYRFRTAKGRYRNVLDKAYILRDKERRAVRMIGAMQDVTSHRNLEKRLLKEVDNRKREVVKAIISAQEREKKMISDELHDNINQLLATCNMYLDVGIKNDPQPMLKECKGILKTAMKEIRNMSHGLTPAAFAEKGLFFTVEEMVGKINVVGKLRINVDVSNRQDLEMRLLPEMKTAIYRIIQEQINNTIKHAAASVALVRVKVVGMGISLEMSDNGKGFDQQNAKKGLGLNNIQSRVELYGGEMAIQSHPGKGCIMKVLIPFAEKGAW